MLYDITFKRTNSISIPDYCTADFMDIWLLLNFTNLRFSERGGHEPIHTHTFALVADLDRYFSLSYPFETDLLSARKSGGKVPITNIICVLSRVADPGEADQDTDLGGADLDMDPTFYTGAGSNRQGKPDSTASCI